MSLFLSPPLLNSFQKVSGSNWLSYYYYYYLFIKIIQYFLVKKTNDDNLTFWVKCDPLCEIQAKVSKSNFEKTNITFDFYQYFTIIKIFYMILLSQY